ncbi:hypothetical protein [Comamonas testosteroni]|uniref:hypothetical protein n=1 Tax=Comamonas testosteroni TaxID=285 RepID=UPI0012D34918|nr:hypothetical protein [Comamonas testosteroni]
MRVTDPDDRPQDRAGFNRLHHICQLWVDYLTADKEASKHKILYETVSHIFHYRKSGAEGEEVLSQVWSAVSKRGRAFDDSRNWVEAQDNGWFRLMGIPRTYPFVGRCSAGHTTTLSFQDINYSGEIVPCEECGIATEIKLDFEVMDKQELQDKANDNALNAELNRSDSLSVMPQRNQESR